MLRLFLVCWLGGWVGREGGDAFLMYWVTDWFILKCISVATYSAISTFCVLGIVLGSGLYVSRSISSSVTFAYLLLASPTNRQPQTFSTMTLTRLLG